MPRTLQRLLVLLLLVLQAPAAPLQEEAPPARSHYKGRQIARTMHYAGAPWLVRESREREEEPAKLLAALELSEGQRVCDLGCGNGFYALPIAEAVGETGRVLAVDIQPEMLALLEERADAAGLSARIEPVLGLPHDPRLPAAALDLVLMVDVYHELSHPELVLGAVRASLAPGGRLVLAEFRAEDPDVPIKPRHKMTKVQVLRELVPNGYRLVGEYDALPWQHLLFFERARGGELADAARAALARAGEALAPLAAEGGYAEAYALARGARLDLAGARELGEGDWLVVPTAALGERLLRAFRVTGGDGFLEAARAGGLALARAQRADGAWPRGAAPEDGAEPGERDEAATRAARRYLSELDALLAEPRLRAALERAGGGLDERALPPAFAREALEARARAALAAQGDAGLWARDGVATSADVLDGLDALLAVLE